MFRTLFRSRRDQTVVRRNLVRKPFRPILEVLEDRFAPAIIDWTAGTGDHFNVAADWTVRGSNPPVHRVPGPADDASINLSNDVITFTESHEVNSLTASVARFQMSGNGTTLTLDNLLKNSSLDHLILGPNTALQALSGITSLTDDSLIAGTLSASRGATLAFTGGTSLMNVDSPLTGLGTYSVAGGTLSISSGVTVAALSAILAWSKRMQIRLITVKA
jgi:hypothetical protein